MKVNNFNEKYSNILKYVIGASLFVLLIFLSYSLYGGGKATFSADETKGNCYECGSFLIWTIPGSDLETAMTTKEFYNCEIYLSKSNVTKDRCYHYGSYSLSYFMTSGGTLRFKDDDIKYYNPLDADVIRDTNSTYEVHTIYNVPQPSAILSGWNFKGWSSKSDDGTGYFVDGKAKYKVFDLEDMYLTATSSGKNYVAIYESTTLKVTFDAGTGKFSDNSSEKKMPYLLINGKYGVLFPNYSDSNEVEKPTNGSKNFLGWVAGESTNCKNGTYVQNDKYYYGWGSASSGKKYSACWEGEDYSTPGETGDSTRYWLYIDPNGGEAAPEDNLVIDYIDFKKLSEHIFAGRIVRDGCSISGWCVDNRSCTNPINGNTVIDASYDGKTLYAQWSCDANPGQSGEFTVSFYDTDDRTLLWQKTCTGGECLGSEMSIPGADKCSSERWCLDSKSNCDSAPFNEMQISSQRFTKTTRFICAPSHYVKLDPNASAGGIWYDNTTSIVTETFTLDEWFITDFNNIPGNKNSACKLDYWLDTTNNQHISRYVDSDNYGHTLVAQWDCSSGDSSGGNEQTECKVTLKPGTGGTLTNASGCGTNGVFDLKGKGKVYFDPTLNKCVKNSSDKCITGWYVESGLFKGQTYHSYIDENSGNPSKSDCNSTLVAQWGSCSSQPSSSSDPEDPSVPGSSSDPEDPSVPGSSSDHEPDEPAPYENPIDDYKCNETTGEWIYILSCQSSSISGAKCKVKDVDPVLLSELTDGAHCSDPKPAGVNSSSSKGKNVSSNAGTGSFTIIVAWLIGIAALVISFCYFRKNNIMN